MEQIDFGKGVIHCEKRKKTKFQLVNPFDKRSRRIQVVSLFSVNVLNKNLYLFLTIKICLFITYWLPNINDQISVSQMSLFKMKITED